MGAGISAAQFSAVWKHIKPVLKKAKWGAKATTALLQRGPGGTYAGDVYMGWGEGPEIDNFLEAFRASPDYKFRLSEGIKAIERSAAARGGLLGGLPESETEEAEGTTRAGVESYNPRGTTSWCTLRCTLGVWRRRSAGTCSTLRDET